MNFLSVGEMVIDFLPGNEPGIYIRKAGGAPANVAIAIARQECDSSFLGMMGNDDFGRFLLDTLVSNGVCPLVTELTSVATTTMAFVSLDEHGDRSFTFARKPGADMFLSCTHIKDEHLSNCDILHAGSCSLSKGDAAKATVYALKEAHNRGKLVSFDVNYRNPLWDDDRDSAAQAVRDILQYVDLLKISEEEIDMVAPDGDMHALMKNYNIALVVETLGGKGARCYHNGTVTAVDGISTQCVDATGAGDAFWGGFLSTLLNKNINSTAKLNDEIISEALRRGNISGCLCVQKRGAIESLPTKQTVEKYLKEHYS